MNLAANVHSYVHREQKPQFHNIVWNDVGNWHSLIIAYPSQIADLMETVGLSTVPLGGIQNELIVD